MHTSVQDGQMRSNILTVTSGMCQSIYLAPHRLHWNGMNDDSKYCNGALSLAAVLANIGVMVQHSKILYYKCITTAAINLQLNVLPRG